MSGLSLILLYLLHSLSSDAQPDQTPSQTLDSPWEDLGDSVWHLRIIQTPQYAATCFYSTIWYWARSFSSAFMSLIPKNHAVKDWSFSSFGRQGKVSSDTRVCLTQGHRGGHGMQLDLVLLTPNPIIIFFPCCWVFGSNSFIPQTSTVALAMTHDFTAVRVLLVPRRPGRNGPCIARSPLAYSQLSWLRLSSPSVTRFPIMVAARPSGGKLAVASLQTFKWRGQSNPFPLGVGTSLWNTPL